MKLVLALFVAICSVLFIATTAWLRLSGRISGLEWLALDAGLGLILLVIAWGMTWWSRRR